MQIGSHVRARRIALGLTQENLATELGVKHQHVSRIEPGDATPSLETVLSLSRILGVTTDYLLTGQDPALPDVVGAIRAAPDISTTAKRHLVGIVQELRSTS
jgi:transcriptional regulator with XRE-family HTH domain